MKHIHNKVFPYQGPTNKPYSTTCRYAVEGILTQNHYTQVVARSLGLFSCHSIFNLLMSLGEVPSYPTQHRLLTGALSCLIQSLSKGVSPFPIPIDLTGPSMQHHVIAVILVQGNFKEHVCRVQQVSQRERWRRSFSANALEGHQNSHVLRHRRRGIRCASTWSCLPA